jgi:hypothetical protein
VRAAAEKKLGAGIVGSDATVKAGSQGLVVDPAADGVIVVTDTCEHADPLQSYQRAVGVATMIGVKPSLAVGL